MCVTLQRHTRVGQGVVCCTHALRISGAGAMFPGAYPTPAFVAVLRFMVSACYFWVGSHSEPLTALAIQTYGEEIWGQPKKGSLGGAIPTQVRSHIRKVHPY